ncbi:protein GLUTAMINE DUMPER 2-like [Coffea arabica]|uniref:Protein GLUTAMINE DUMPER 2-like n=1 Tax=Coffea arabica TaxID=13443 RepID=A0A6P6T8H9_COFAR|nr:protein GLUTAMINE DUMPER 2-like [Coffea arabica]
MVVPAKTPSFWQWNSPLPYLFFGLGAMLTLITVALVILACSYHKRFSNVSGGDEEKSSVKPSTTTAAAMTPQIVVIMAGDENPSHLAVPVSSPPDNCPDEQGHHHV